MAEPYRIDIRKIPTDRGDLFVYRLVDPRTGDAVGIPADMARRRRAYPTADRAAEDARRELAGDFDWQAAS